MLVLTRNVGQRIKIGDNIWVTIVESDRGRVRIGIEAPKEVRVDREEVYLAREDQRQPPQA